MNTTRHLPNGSARSDQLYDNALHVIPGGLMSNLKRSHGFKPFYIESATGARLTDVDGNEHIDYMMSYGAAILGHGHSVVREAAHAQIDRLSSYHSAAIQIDAAEAVIRCIPSAELVRFCPSGVEANRAALRLARAFTGRNQYVRFQGHYHGQLDHLMGGLPGVDDGPTPIAGSIDGDPFTMGMVTAGRNRYDYQQTYLTEWNDLDALSQLFERLGDDIAAVLMEPVMLNHAGCMPQAEYLQSVKQLCERNGTLLIFDEVLTGFRIGVGGAQAAFSVEPDLTTLGKALGGGLPVAAFCGRAEIMDLVGSGKVIEGGTYNGHPLSMASVVATLGFLQSNGGEVYGEMERLGTRLRDGLLVLASEHGLPMLLQGFPGCYTMLLSDLNEVSNHHASLGSDHATVSRLAQLARDRGVQWYGRFFLSAGHTERDVDQTLDVFSEALRTL